MKNNTKFTLSIIAASFLGAVLALGIYMGFSQGSSLFNTRSLSNTLGQKSDAAHFTGNMQQVALAGGHVPDNFVEAAERSVHGVVNVRSEIGSRTKSHRQQRFIDPFELFFGQRGMREPQEQPGAVSIGSGVIISTDGYIITNNHVIKGASKVTVSTNDNKEYEATIVGSDPATDLALLKIDAKNLPVIPFGDSEALQVGEWVLAVGNPFNLSSTVTAGIVSAKGRSTVNDGSLQVASFIQTDAAVNRGNSGGALVNTKGELVGINTMIYSSTGTYAGYSFAIPVSIAAKVVADLKQYGVVQRAILGVSGANLNPELIKKFNLKVSEGAFVGDFATLSPAKQAGIQKEDVITAVNGIDIRNMAELQEQISKYRPGDKVKVDVDRKGKSLSFNIALKNLQGNTDIVRNNDFSSLGAAFKSISTEKMQQFGINYGVEIAGLDDGKLKSAGMQKGDIILAINNTVLRSPEDLKSVVNSILSSPSADKVLFIKAVEPNGKLKYLAVDLS